MKSLEALQSKLTDDAHPTGFWVGEPQHSGYFQFEDGTQVNGFGWGWGRGASPEARCELAKAIWACGWTDSPEAAARLLQDVAWTDWTNGDGRLAPFDI